MDDEIRRALRALETAIAEIERAHQNYREENDREVGRLRAEVSALRREAAPPWKKSARVR